jgi:hypothetical protein
MKNIATKIASVILFTLFLSGCGGIPEGALRLTTQSLELRQMQQKEYSEITERQALVSAANVLQDIGYIIKESEPKLGFILAEKDRDATDGGQVAAAIFVALLTGQSSAIDSRQKIKVSVITRKRDNEKMIIRVSFQRVVWNTNNQVSRQETIKDKEIYKDFFAKLDKSIFLTKEGV